MSICKKLLGTINAIAVIVLCLCTAIELPTFNLKFYNHEYKKYNIHESIQVELNELLRTTEHLLDYMKGDKETLDIETNVNGVIRPFFNQKEKDHMVDVKNLFDIGFLVRNIAFGTFIATILLLCVLRIRFLSVIARANQIVLSVFMFAMLIITFVISLDFDRSFTMFHKIFFTNDLWILDPETDLLVNIVPLPFFMDIAALISVVFCSFMVIIILTATIYLKNCLGEDI